MTRLYFDQRQSAGRRYYFALDAVPGILTPNVATLTLFGRDPAAAEPSTVFRSPAVATLTLSGQLLQSPGVLSPNVAALNVVGQIPAEQRILTITLTVPPLVEAQEISYAPTLLTQWLVQPGMAQLGLATLPQNVTQGGNIGFLNPGVGSVVLSSIGLSMSFGYQAGATAQLLMQGLAPNLSLRSVGTITPDVGALIFSGHDVRLSLPFIWIDDDPVPTPTWIDEAAA